MYSVAVILACKWTVEGPAWGLVLWRANGQTKATGSGQTDLQTIPLPKFDTIQADVRGIGSHRRQTRSIAALLQQPLIIHTKPQIASDNIHKS